MTRHRTRWFAVLAVLIAAILVHMAGTASAQTDSLGAAVDPPRARASWLTDKVELRAGDIVTVVIDEETAAEERVSTTGTDRRSLRAEFQMKSDGEVSPGTTGPSAQYAAESSQGGQARRQGGLYGVLSTRVVSVDATGAATIEGKKTLTVDGRDQEITIKGLVRPQDLSSNNTVYSSRLADAVITYKGKDLGPKRGIFGKILSILWPF